MPEITDRYGLFTAVKVPFCDHVRKRTVNESVLIDLGSVVWTDTRKKGMFLVFVIAMIGLVAQLGSIEDLNVYRNNPEREASLFLIFIGTLTSLVGLWAFGPPYSPSIITISMLLIMLIVRPVYPGLIVNLEEVMVTLLCLGLSVEYFIVGKLYGSDF